jgi:Rieske Fe-S protein
MADDPQRRFEEDLALDARIDAADRRGLTGTARADVYEDALDPEDVTVAPDGRPMAEQPRWRRDFAIDWPEDHHVARRDFARFLVLTSGAFVAGQAWIAAQSLVRHRGAPPARKRIAALADVPVGSALMFAYPGEHDPCLLIRLDEQRLVAFSQKCTHLSCAVIPKLEEGVLHCPCHEGYFDLETGQNIAGPPPRPLPEIELAIEGGEVFAVAVHTRTA